MIFGFKILRSEEKRISKKTASDYKREALISLGKEQFKKLLERGINIPVALL